MYAQYPCGKKVMFMKLREHQEEQTKTRTPSWREPGWRVCALVQERQEDMAVKNTNSLDKEVLINPPLWTLKNRPYLL